MQHALVMFFTCFNEFFSHIGIKDKVLGEMKPLHVYMGIKKLYESYLAVVAASVHPLGFKTCM